MKNNDQKTQGKRGRSVPQEMQQAFVEWVNKLPFIKRGIAKDPGQEDAKEESAGQASAPRPTDGALAGRSLDNKARHR